MILGPPPSHHFSLTICLAALASPHSSWPSTTTKPTLLHTCAASLCSINPVFCFWNGSKADVDVRHMVHGEFHHLQRLVVQQQLEQRDKRAGVAHNLPLVHDDAPHKRPKLNYAPYLVVAHARFGKTMVNSPSPFPPPLPPSPSFHPLTTNTEDSDTFPFHLPVPHHRPATAGSVILFVIGLATWERGVVDTRSLVKLSLELVLHKENLPALLCCSCGVGQCAVVAGCPRRMQLWSLASIFAE